MKKPRLGIIILILWGLFLCGAVSMYLKHLQPSRLGGTVAGALESTLGMPSSIRQVDFFFFPNPEVRIYGLRFEYAGERSLEFRADSCVAQLSWLSLLTMRPVLRMVDLQGPVIDAVLAPAGAESPPAASPRSLKLALPESIPDLPPSITGIRVRINNGTLRLRQAESPLNVQLNGINGYARLPGLASGSMDIMIRKTQMRFARTPQISLDNFSLRATSVNEDNTGNIKASLTLSTQAQMASLEQALGRPLKPAYQYFPLPEPARLESVLDIQANSATRVVSLSGRAKADLTLPMNGHNTPISLNVPFSMQDFNEIQINGMNLSAYQDKAQINGVLTGLADKAPLFTGQAKVQHFSLTHWFGFSRKMTGGLQLALDHISGNLDFALTPKGVDAPHLEARVGEAVLVGSGSCKDFRKPVIVIDGKTEYVDLNPFFPELNGIKTPKPDLPPPAVPTSDNNPDSPAKVSFQIRLRADKADIHKLSAGKADCLIFPINDPYSPERLASGEPLYDNTGAQMTIKVGDLYGGNADSLVLLESPYDIHAELNNVALEEPVARLAGFPAMGGLLQGVADVSFHGSSPAEMISNLEGTASASLSDGFFGSKAGERSPYSKLLLKVEAEAEAGSIPLEYDLPPVMDFRGRWDADLTTPAYQIRLISDALLRFNMKNGLPQSMQPQKSDIRLRLDKEGFGLGLFPDDINLKLQAKVGFDIEKESVTVADISGGRSGLVLKGSLRAENILSSLSVKGPVEARTGILREISPLFGLPLPPTAKSDALSLLEFKSDVTYTRNGISFSGISGLLDSTSLQGNMAVSFGSRPFWKADLRLGEVNGDDYWPASDGGAPSPVQVDALLKHDADLRLNVNRFSLFSSPVQNLVLPITLTRGEIATGVFTGAFPGGGSLSGTFQGEARAAAKDPKGAQVSPGSLSNRLQLRMNNINMLELTKARGQDTLVAGTGAFQLDAQAQLKHWNDLPRNIDGNWSIQVNNGYVVSAKAQSTDPYAAIRNDLGVAPIMGNATAGGSSASSSNQTSKSSRTFFQSISASGNILSGVVHSNDFVMKSGVMVVRGGGNINLNSKSIEAKATATLLGVPEIPMEISGPLDKPKTSYKVMGAVTGTIGNLGGSMLDVVSGIITAPFKLFGAGR